MRTVKTSSRLADRAKARHKEGIVLPAVQEGMLKDYGLDDDRRWDIIHPSELSHQDTFCPRAVYLRITEGPVVKEKFDFVRENIFDYGNDRHSSWQDRLRTYTQLWGDWKCLICGRWERGCLEPGVFDNEKTGCDTHDGAHIWEYKEVTLDAEEDALLAGHADGGLLDQNCLVEIKTVGEGSVRIEAPTLYRRHATDSGTDMKGMWNDITHPFKTHLNQGDIYLWICAQRGLPFTKISYVYECKWNQQVKEWVIEYDEARSVFLVDQAKSLMYAVKHRTEPDCKFPGKCRECKPYDARRAGEGSRRTVELLAE